ncbi:MAG TPA: lipid-A-disaccharide synthase [Terriglobales bacterium]|nr:lipid-A-disaccharide synthase [Terriglobales bacterium]
MRVLISAGEASGEMYGAELIQALRRHLASATDLAGVDARSHTDTARVEFFGVGGEKMRAAGCDLVVDAKELSVVGITEILGHLPKIWGLFRRLISEADKRKPDLAIVIDSPAFNWRVAREMKKRGVPVVYYVCPQFWAWRQGRVRYLRRYVDKALVIFPFEEKFYRDRGVNAEFVGHPLAMLPRPTISRAEYAAQHALDPAKQWITLMPGSRIKEVFMNLSTIVDASLRLGDGYEFLLPVAPTLDREFLWREICAETNDDSRSTRTELPNIHLVPDALPALTHSRAAIVASGTATVEAALMETPFVMVYRVTPLSYLVGRWMVKVPHFAMVNLIAGERVVPELVQKDFTAERVVAELRNILPDGPSRSKMIEGLRKIRMLLQAEGSSGPAPERAAAAIVRLLGGRFDRKSTAEAAN